MQLFFEQEEMHKALQTVQKAIPVRTPLNVLKGICLELKGNVLTLTATDLELGIRTCIHVQGLEEGSIILPERFVEIVKSLPPGSVEMRVEEKSCMAVLTYEDIEFQLHGFPAEEFPAFPHKGEGHPDALIPGFLLNTMLNKTLITVSTDQSKPAFTGVNFQMEGDTLCLTSSDTFRLSMITDKIKDMLMEDTQFIVPAKSLRELMRVVKEHDVVSLTVVKGLAIFGFGETLLTTSLLADKFPNISRVIPTDAFTTITVNKNLLEMALGRTSLLADSEIHTVVLDVQKSRITLHSQSALGTNHEIVPVKTFEGEEVTLIMNIRFISDVMKVITGSEVLLLFKGKNGPCVVKPTTGEDYLYLALPIKPE